MRFLLLLVAGASMLQILTSVAAAGPELVCHKCEGDDNCRTLKETVRCSDVPLLQGGAANEANEFFCVTVTHLIESKLVTRGCIDKAHLKALQASGRDIKPVIGCQVSEVHRNGTKPGGNSETSSAANRTDVDQIEKTQFCLCNTDKCNEGVGEKSAAPPGSTLVALNLSVLVAFSLLK